MITHFVDFLSRPTFSPSPNHVSSMFAVASACGSSSDSCVEILIPYYEGVRRWALGRWCCHDGGTPMDGISALTEEAPQSSLTPFFT